MEYSDQTLYISDLAQAEGVNFVIDDSTFTNCIVRGPAVVSLIDTSASSGSVEIPNQDPKTVVLVAEDDRTVIPVGVVVLRNCQFAECTFEGVTFFGPKAYMEFLTETFMSNVPE